MIFSPKTIKWWQTVNLNLGVFAVGLSIAVAGVAIIDLSEIYKTEVDQIVYTISTRSAGAIVACGIGGFIFSRVNGQLVVFTSTLLGGLCLAAIPNCPSLFWNHVASFIMGACIGLVEIGANVWLITIWKEHGPPVLQFYHFMFGVGAMVAPFITEPFLSKKIGMSSENSTLSSIVTTESKISIPFGIFGGAYIIASFLMLLAYFANRDDIKQEENEEKTDRKVSPRIEFMMVALMCIFVLIAVALEQTFASIAGVYVVNNLNFSKSTAAFLVSVFWGSFTVSRVVATILSLKLKPMPLLIICQVGLMISATVLVFFPRSEIVIWSMTALFAFTLSPFFGNVCGWALKYIFLGHNCMSAIFVSVCTGALSAPVILGPFIERYPMIFTFAIFSMTALMTLVAGGLVVLGRYIDSSNKKSATRYDPVETNELHADLCKDEA